LHTQIFSIQDGWSHRKRTHKYRRNLYEESKTMKVTEAENRMVVGVWGRGEFKEMLIH
jgi:hypothetical protein